MNKQFRVILNPRKLDTAEAAAVLRVRPQTLRRALCLNGHYLGLRPTKLPNGRLLWDAADLDRLTAGEVAA
ncbi:hypothetical protein MXC99_11265 [Thauera aromatica]|uniref:hypothetical protein n=1 Tax=Thauera aromatica TaxID=59405 RepID=UPI001FFDE96B|nr:hypothetical protein [Thauera aromatica]MCK2088750.1 hypothetical protein [Thauera aromatica]MCK2127651.1 hypothetical protein [Thauera aromatica]